MNIYSHMFQEAKARNCDAITNALSFSKKDMAGNTEYADEDEQEEKQLKFPM